MISRRALAPSFMFVATLIAGCGQSGSKEMPVKVKGKLVTAGGAPFHDNRPANKPLPPGDTGVRVKFTSQEGTADPGQPRPSYTASVDPETGTFDVPGPTGQGIPAGKYRVTVHVGAAGENAAAPATPSMVPPTVENAGEDTAGLDGKEVARTQVTVPAEGVTDLAVEVRAGKK